MKKKNTSYIILQRSFRRLQKTNPSFSLRALAMKLGISHVFLSKILKGDANIPDDKLAKLIRYLKLDDLSKRELKDAIIKDAIEQKLAAFDVKEITFEDDLITTEFEELPTESLRVLENWYDLAICDLLTTNSEGPWNIKQISQTLGLPPEDIEESISKLEKLELIKATKKGWIKLQTKLRFPATTPKEITKNYYQQILDKAASVLELQSQEEYNRRLITNISIAVDQSKVEYAKEELQKFTYKLSQELSRENVDSVYFLTTCFYPVTK